MTFEEYEKIAEEFRHVSLELFHEKNINVGNDISQEIFYLTMNYEQENLGKYKKRLLEYKSMLSK